MVKIRNVLLLLLALLSTGTIFAQSAHPPTASSVNPTSTSPVFPGFRQGHLVVQGGGFWSHQGKSQHVNIEGLIGDQFTVKRHNDSNGMFGLGYFFDGRNVERFDLNYGLNFFYFPKTKVSGVVEQENLFTNLSYAYKISHYPVYVAAQAKTKLFTSNLFLTLDAGIGPNFMSTSKFKEHSLDGGITLPDNAFSGHTTTTFSATVGAGLQLGQVLGNMPLECGYRFFYLGQGRLSKSTNQLINTLHTGSVYANAVLCSIRI